MKTLHLESWANNRTSYYSPTAQQVAGSGRKSMRMHIRTTDGEAFTWTAKDMTVSRVGEVAVLVNGYYELIFQNSVSAAHFHDVATTHGAQVQIIPSTPPAEPEPTLSKTVTAEQVTITFADGSQTTTITTTKLANLEAESARLHSLLKGKPVEIDGTTWHAITAPQKKAFEAAAETLGDIRRRLGTSDRHSDQFCHECGEEL